MRRNLATSRASWLALSLIAAVGGSLAGASGWVGVRLAPAKTWVGLARVHLEVSELTVVDDALVGTYEIQVPLAREKGDRGTVRFELTGPLDRALGDGAVLLGSGTSVLDRRTHRISCSFGDHESVRIDIDTGQRRLSFRSRWTVGG